MPSISFHHVHVVFFICDSRLQVTLERLTGLKAILGLEGDPAVDCTSLDTDHVLVTVLGFKVGDSLGTLLPRVPDDSILHVVSDDIQTRLVVDED